MVRCIGRTKRLVRRRRTRLSAYRPYTLCVIQMIQRLLTHARSISGSTRATQLSWISRRLVRRSRSRRRLRTGPWVECIPQAIRWQTQPSPVFLARQLLFHEASAFSRSSISSTHSATRTTVAHHRTVPRHSVLRLFAIVVCGHPVLFGSATGAGDAIGQAMTGGRGRGMPSKRHIAPGVKSHEGCRGVQPQTCRTQFNQALFRID